MQKHEDKPHAPRIVPEPSSDRRESVAAVLRRAREKHGQDVRSVAQVLRIRQAYLEALEAGAFDRLPGSAYAIGFLRTYAEYLGLNADNVIDRFKEEVQGPERRTELVFPEPVAEGRIPGGAIILISVALLAVAYGGWFYLSNQGRSVADLIPALPGQIQTLIDGDGQGPAPVAQYDAGTVAETPAEAPQTPEPAEAAVAEAPAATAPSEAPAEPAARPEPAPSDIAAVRRKPERTPVQAADPAPAPAPEIVPEVASDPEPSPPVAVAEPLAPPETPVETVTIVQDTAPERIAEPAAGTQVAVLPERNTQREVADDAYAGPPLNRDPAPELEALIRDETPVPLPSADPVEPAQVVERTFVIPAPSAAPAPPPAPPAAPRNFTMPGERAPQVYGESNENARIVLRALQDSWVQIRDGQDALLLTRVLRSGDVYRVPDRSGLTLLTGNAGGIELAVDGVTLPPLGPIGAVRRQITLDPAALLSAGRQ